jgi:hypothetical protein
MEQGLNSESHQAQILSVISTHTSVILTLKNVITILSSVISTRSVISTHKV